MLQAVMLHLANRPQESEDRFRLMFASESSIALDHWVAPFAHYEYARLLVDLQRYAEAYAELKKVQKGYADGYSNQNRLAFRVHHELEMPYFKQFKS
jgi:hypothetical protein